MNVFLAGWFGSGNQGDEAILVSELEVVRQALGDVLVCVPSFNAHGTRELLKGRAESVNVVAMGSKLRFFGSDLLGFIRGMAKSDLVVVGGGGLFQDIYNMYPIPYFTAIILIGRLLRKRVVILAIGVGPVRTSVGTVLTRLAFRLAAQVSVRGPDSARELVRLGVRRSVETTADLAFLLQPTLTERVKGYAGEDGRSLSMVGVSVQELFPWGAGIQSAFAEALDELGHSNRCRIVFIPFGHYVDSWRGAHATAPIDVASCKRVSEVMKCESTVVEQALTPQELMALVGEMRLMISMRFHGLVMALAMGVPAVAVTYRKEIKLAGLMDRIDRGDDVVRIEEFRARSLVDRARELLSSTRAVRRGFDESAAELKGLARANVAFLRTSAATPTWAS